MSTFKPYAVQANLGGMALLCASVSTDFTWNVPEYSTPGTAGNKTSHNGRKSRRDSVTALLTVPEVERLEKLGNEKNFHQWTHPLLSMMFCRIENLSIPATPDLWGYFAASFTLIEHFERDQGLFLYRPNPASAKAKADNVYANLGFDLDGLDAGIPSDLSDDLSSGWSDLGAGFDGLSESFEGVVDGTGSWRSLSASLDVFTTAADSFVDTVRDAADYMHEDAFDLVSGVTVLKDTVMDAVDTVKRTAENSVSFVTTAPGDLYSMMIDAGVDITEDAIRTIMDDTGIEDPMFIPPGFTVTLPIAA